MTVKIPLADEKKVLKKYFNSNVVAYDKTKKEIKK